MSELRAGVGRADITPPVGIPAGGCSPFPTTLVSGYWNGYRNYLPTDAERARGGYEIDISPFRPGAEALVTAAAGRVLEAL